MIDVCLLGTGGMMPLPQRALTSLYVRHEGRAVMIDCGEGTQTAVRRAGLRFKCIDAVLLTHFHADHVSGLPGLLLTMGNEGRTEPLKIYGPEGLNDVIGAMRVIVPELPFGMEIIELHGREGQFECGGLDVSAFPADHGMPCIGYAVELKRRGKFDPRAARNKGIPVGLWSRLQAGERVGGYGPEDVLSAPRRGLKLVYATDTRPVPEIEQFGRAADLMILEGMFGDPEKQARAEESRHMMMQEAAQLAARLQARRLWLTHFSPATPEPELYEEELKGIFAETVIGSDGMKCTLRFED